MRKRNLILIALVVVFGSVLLFSGPGTTSLETVTGKATSDGIFTIWQAPRRLPEIHFVNGQGQEVALADFRGKYLLLNVWATWCPPCREEMPSLDRLQEKMDSHRFAVIPVSIDGYNLSGINLVKEFYLKYQLKNLEVYLDSTGALSDSLDVVGLPTTLLIDPQGREIGRKVGSEAWDSAEVIARLSGHIRSGKP